MHLFVNLTTDSAALAAKALRMAGRFAATDWEVTVFLNVDGVRLAAPSDEPATCPATGKPLPTMLADLVTKADVLVGADCLKVASLSPDDLMDGCVPADLDRVQERLALDGTRVFSY
ncbi:hypothetical protein GF314_14415 [bacterium]|nr:hypothetical protein [bacterium]